MGRIGVKVGWVDAGESTPWYTVVSVPVTMSRNNVLSVGCAVMVYWSSAVPGRGVWVETVGVGVVRMCWR